MADGPNPLRQGPENYADLGDMLGSILSTFAKQMENMLPVKVVSYDQKAKTVVVQPQLKVILTAGVKERAQIGPLPVFVSGAGNYVLSFPIKEGDKGWMIANDRDISGYLSSLVMEEPATYRSHSFNDAVFFPDPIRNYDRTAHEDGAVLQSMDGTQRIALTPNQMFFDHPVGVTVNTGGVTINAPVQATSLTAANGITGSYVDGNGKIMNFNGGLLVG